MNIIIKASAIAALGACGAEEANKNGAAGKMEEVPATAAAGETHSGTGTVTNISGNAVTISHEEIRSIGWPAMTMAFTANDAALLKDIEAGDRVSFAFSKAGSAFTLTSITKQ
ncbi:MAG TPA: copper-binding protein [Herpetosiphonaceae bacterium]|nr:copper-binding protein [Herpetosiphonaceae bacterium]